MAEPTISPSESPTYIPSFVTDFPTYTPTETNTPTTEMEKGKSQKSPVNETDDEKKDKDKSKDQKESESKETPVRPPFGRPPSTVSRPGSTFSRPAPFSSLRSSIPSLAPSEELLPDSITESLTDGVVTTSKPSETPSTETAPSSSPSEMPSAVPSNELPSNELPSYKPSQTPSTQTAEEQSSLTAPAKQGSTTKVTINGDILSKKKESSIYVDKNGKVSFSGKKDELNDDRTTKLTMSGVLSNKKYDDAKISISGRGKVSFGGNREETPEPSPAPLQSKKSHKISMNGIQPTKNNNKSPTVSIGRNGKVPFSRSGTISSESTSEPSYIPTYLPTADLLDGNKQPSSTGGSGKISLTFPTSGGQKQDESKTSSTSKKQPSSSGGSGKISLSLPTSSSESSAGSNKHQFKPISFYTDVPTTDATVAPSPSPSKKKRKDKKKKTPSPKVDRESEEPTIAMYPTYYPTSDLGPKESRIYESSGYPTYWPSYVPTGESNHLFVKPTFGLGEGSDRDNKFGLLDFNAPSENNTLSNETTVMEFMGSGQTTVVPEQADTEDAERDGTLSLDASDDAESDGATDSYQKRICPGLPLGVNPSAPKVEQEVFFTYGIEVSSDESSLADAVEVLQMKILEDTAKLMLRCDRRELWWGKRDHPVSRVYYKRDSDISVLSKCSASVKSMNCAIVETVIYLTVLEGREDEARVEALYLLNHKMDEGEYGLEYTKYLGPDIEQLSVYLERKSNITSSSLSTESSSISHLFYAAIAVVSLAICALVVFGIVVGRNRRQKKTAMQYERFANSTIPSRSKDSYSPHPQFIQYPAADSSSYNIIQPTDELSDWRSFVGRERF